MRVLCTCKQGCARPPHWPSPHCTQQVMTPGLGWLYRCYQLCCWRCCFCLGCCPSAPRRVTRQGPGLRGTQWTWLHYAVQRCCRRVGARRLTHGDRAMPTVALSCESFCNTRHTRPHRLASSFQAQVRLTLCVLKHVLCLLQTTACVRCSPTCTQDWCGRVQS